MDEERDRSDLLGEIDQALGESIERTLKRYLPHRELRGARRQVVSFIGDVVQPPPPVEVADPSPASGGVAVTYYPTPGTENPMVVNWQQWVELIRPLQSRCRGR